MAPIRNTWSSPVPAEMARGWWFHRGLRQVPGADGDAVPRSLRRDAVVLDHVWAPRAGPIWTRIQFATGRALTIEVEGKHYRADMVLLFQEAEDGCRIRCDGGVHTTAAAWVLASVLERRIAEAIVEALDEEMDRMNRQLGPRTSPEARSEARA